MSNDGNGSSREYKIARLIDRYGLGDEYGDRLESLWTAEGDDRESLRTLADRFNRRLLEVTLADAGIATVDGEIDNTYRLLTDDDVSSGSRTEVRQRLERNGIDVNELEGDFVTYQAIRSYLQRDRGASYDDERGEDSAEAVIDTLQRLKSRNRSVGATSLERLKNAGRISLGQFRLFVDISVLCEDCNSQYDVVELIRRGGCDCELAGTVE